MLVKLLGVLGFPIMFIHSYFMSQFMLLIKFYLKQNVVDKHMFHWKLLLDIPGY